MQWWTTEEKWWSGALVSAFLSAIIVKRVLNKNELTFYEAIQVQSPQKAVIAALKMWLVAQLYFLLIAFAYYFVIGVFAAIANGSLHLNGFAVAGVFWVTKLVGLLISNVLFIPVICGFAFLVYKVNIKIANKIKNENAASGTDASSTRLF